MRKNVVCDAVQTNFVRVKHVSGKVKFSDILTNEDKYKVHYIILRYHIMYRLLILDNIRLCINICENIWVILTYGDICHHNSPPKNISDLESTYNNFYTMNSVVDSKGSVAKPTDVYPSTGPSVSRTSLGLK